jgi:hypothetical protein
MNDPAFTSSEHVLLPVYLLRVALSSLRQFIRSSQQLIGISDGILKQENIILSATEPSVTFKTNEHRACLNATQSKPVAINHNDIDTLS